MKRNSNNTLSLSKDNAAARRRLRRRIIDTLRKPTTQTTKLAKESKMVLLCFIEPPSSCLQKDIFQISLPQIIIPAFHRAGQCLEIIIVIGK